ncbi:glycogenin glucosyltransferase [Serendipita sp. 396]|nr:glycogenin glucosyltransferase [Serendipita sp. 396]KAG8872668.1 glycogenin glucosyltransferase [Serendipita sp. 405]
MSGPFAFVTLLSSDSYLPGALVLAASLKDLHPTPATAPEVDFQTVCLVTPENVSVTSIKALRKAFDVVVGVEILEANSPSGLKLLGRPDLSTVLTKLHVFRLTTYAKIIFLDADILPLQPISHLFLTPYEFSACPDVGWPDIFNSGLMVLQPGDQKFNELMDLTKSKGSWDGADQGLLNEWRGSDWNRLSFVYNTTPTAAYTYAPAYERFGAAIRAIHFIGQNKPWASIPWRAPVPHHSVESMNSYGYSQLVDRWFAVYDRHYRPLTRATEEEYRMQHYPSTWESAAFEAASTGLGLEDLKKLAIDGVLKTTPATSGEGTYTSLPLEGRIDLMRPRQPPSESMADLPGDAHPGDAHDQYRVSSHSVESHTEYRPPGREGLPDYLYRPPAPEEQTQQAQSQQEYLSFSSQQGEPPKLHHVEPVPWYQQQQQQESQDDRHGAQSPEYRPPSPPKMMWDPAREPPPSVLPPIVGMAFAEQQYQNVWDMLPSIIPLHHQSTPYKDPWAHGQGSQGYQGYQPQHHHQHQHQHQHQHHHHRHDSQHHWTSPESQRADRHHHHHTEYRPEYHHGGRSEHRHQHQHQHWQHQQRQDSHQHERHQSHSPKEARKDVTGGGNSYFVYQPYQSSTDSHDQQQSHPESAHHHSYHQRPEAFFHPPAPSSIPQRLVREGHYAAVIAGESKPDSAKVEAIFPWEQRSRPTPKRVFPDWDPKPPALRSPPKSNNLELEMVEETPQAVLIEEITRRRSPSPPPHVRRKFNPPPSPPKRQGSTYSNAWDEDRGIQRYAFVLQGRPSPFSPSPPPWPTHPGQVAHAKAKQEKADNEEEEEYTNWTERAEASSRDGDDEDDEEGSPVLSPRSAARRRAAKGKGVQVNTYVLEDKRPKEITIRRYLSTGTAPGPEPFTESPERAMSPEAKGNNTTTKSEKDSLRLVDPPSYFPSMELGRMSQSIKASAGVGSPTTPTLRKRESSEDSVTTEPESSIISSPTKEAEDTVTSKVNIRAADAPEPSSLVGARISSGDGMAVRRVSRVFSPTTGVEIFKRGSEEVLARFLKQQPTGWDAARQDAGPPTPSAIH